MNPSGRAAESEENCNCRAVVCSRPRCTALQAAPHSAGKAPFHLPKGAQPMVVLAAGMTTKSLTLFSRQFVDMPRMRVEGLFNSFPSFHQNGSKRVYECATIGLD